MTPSRLSVRGASKAYPGVQALSDVDLDVAPGEIHALLGENGAGKSTLLKILSGAQASDSGTISLDNSQLSPRDSPLDRQRRGIVTIYQELTLVPDISIAENLFLGREPRGHGLIDWRALNDQTATVLDQIGLDLPPDRPVRGLSVAQQQMVEIARALTMNARLIIMDEPTAALSDAETDTLHGLARRLADEGVSILYVTHRLSEVISLCHHYSVLRDGRNVDQGDVKTATVADLVASMVGRNLTAAARSTSRQIGETVLTLSAPPGSSMTAIDLKAGEIVGIAGLVGSGRTELMRRVIGADPQNDGSKSPFSSPAKAAMSGVYLVPEDRKAQGCFLSHAVGWNLSLISLPRLSGPLGFLKPRSESELVTRFIDRLAVRTPSADTAIGALSGGNQQKVLLARCMAVSPRLLIVDEPTRGIDIGAKGEVHQILFDLAAEGVAIVVISSDMPELLELSDRILVMHEARIVGERRREDVEEGALMTMMTGAHLERAPRHA